MIETPRLILRPWQLSDLPTYVRMNQDPDVMRYFPALMTSEQSRASYDRALAHQAKHGYCFFAAHHVEDDRFIGFIGLSNPWYKTHFTPCVEIGWRLTPEYWGKGLATEGAQACLDYAFSVLDLDKVLSYTPTSNMPSRRVMEKIGMHLIDTFEHPLVAEGDPLKVHVLYQITAEEHGTSD